MAGSKALAGLAVLLLLVAAAAVLPAATATATAAAAAGDEHMYHWKCFKSCNTRCHDDDDKVAGGLNASVSVGGAGHRCKKGCLNECFEDIPALCYQQCVVSTCLCKPPYSKEKMECMKMCCDKCFHHVPAPPLPPPKPPTPYKPPTPTKPPAPKPPTPTPKPPSPTPKPPTPKPPPSPKPPRPPCPPRATPKKTLDNIEN